MFATRSEPTPKPSALDTLSLAATAASAALDDVTLSPPVSIVSNSPGASPSEVSSPETTNLRSPMLNNLALLCDKAATAKSTVVVDGVALAGSGPLQDEDQVKPEPTTPPLAQNGVQASSRSPPVALPTLAAMFPNTTPPPSDHSASRWAHPNHSSDLKPSQVTAAHTPIAPAVATTSPEAGTPIHPQLAALSGTDAYPSPGGTTYSPMSIASLTTPMFKRAENGADGADEGSALPHGEKRKQYAGMFDTMPYTNNNGSSNANGGSTSGARKKRQCSQCQGWYSNLATHRSTHLADNSRPHACDVCNRGFARPNDLFRHLKSHRGDAPFRCPLFVRGPLPHTSSTTTTTGATNGGFGNLEPSCHQNGGFSRCDTYKNHLKAMHFEYPPGTKKKQRSGMRGKCKACGLGFESSEVWIEKHIETGECEIVGRIKAMRNSP